MKCRNRNSQVTIVAAFVAVATALPITHAQETTLEEIVVTARKREQSVMETPLAISAFGNAELKAAAYENIVDVSKAAPGVFIETINGTNAKVDTSPRFRGITFETSSPLQRTGSIFIDGILVSGGIQTIGVQELNRVEIIKGPQSALFGRNTFSGAINYVTKDPSKEFQGDASVSAASRGEYRIAASVEGPIFGEVLSARVSANYNSKSGHYDNAIVEGQRLGDEESVSVTGTALYEPNDKLRIKLRTSFYEDQDGPAAFVRTSGFSQHNFGGFPLAGGGTTETAYQGTIQIPGPADIGLDTSQAVYDTITSLAVNDPRGANFIGLDFDDLGGPGLLREGARLAIEVGYEFNNGLQFDFLTGYNEDEYIVYTDFDASAGFGFNTTGGRAIRDFSVEGRLSGQSLNDRLRWSVGANFVDINVEGVGGFYDGFLGFWFGGVFNDFNVTAAETTGIFGTLEYEFTDQLTVILEARSQEDEIYEDAVNAGLVTPISPTTFDSFLPRLLIQYEPFDDALLYFNYSVGNLPGGFNPEIGELDATQLAEFNGLVPGVGTSFDEETLTNYEFGWKQTALGGRLAVNSAVFFMERSDQIFSGFEIVADPTEINGNRTVAYTANGASTDIFGAEIEGTWLATESLRLQGTVAYVNAEIASFPAGSNSGDFTAVFGPDANVEGQRAPRFPEWSSSLSASYERPVSIGDWYSRGDIFYTGEFFDENTNLAKTPSAVDINLRTGVRLNNNTTIELFVTNLLDEDAPAGANNIADTGTDVRTQSGLFDFSQESVHIALRDRRQVGIRFEVSFD